MQIKKYLRIFWKASKNSETTARLSKIVIIKEMFLYFLFFFNASEQEIRVCFPSDAQKTSLIADQCPESHCLSILFVL